MEPEREAASAAGEESDDEPNLPILNLPAALLDELLALAKPVGLARMRRTNKACHDIHVPLAERIIEQRLKAAVAARGHRTLAAGTSHTVCVRQGDGAPYSWGRTSPYDNDNALSLLGQGQENGPPVRVPAPMVGLGGVSVREVAAGREHTLMLGACGGVWSCGIGKSGVLGHGDKASHAAPRRIESLAQVRAVQVAAGALFSLVLSAAGHVYSFGFGYYGQLGHGDVNDQLLPRRIAALRHTRICQVRGGAYHSLAVGEEGELYAWGCGQLGLGARQRGNQLLPARVALPVGVRIRQASAGTDHSLAVATDGALYSWGSGECGVLGHGDEEKRWVPTLVEALADTPVRSAAAGYDQSAVVTEAGEVYTFGGSGYGQLGHAGDTVTRLVPKAVEALAGKEVEEVVAGGARTVVRLAGGELYAFGYNRDGRLGTGEAGEVLWLPTKVALPEAPPASPRTPASSAAASSSTT